MSLFNQEQDAFPAGYLKTMDETGYGYSRQETINLASDYCRFMFDKKDQPLQTDS